MNNTFKHAIMDVHNTRRSQLKNGFKRYILNSYHRDPGVPKVTPRNEQYSRLYITVPNLPQLSWDNALAWKAQEWADKLACEPYKTIFHPDDLGDTGENIAWTGSRTGNSDLASWQNVADQMEHWWTEFRFAGKDQLRSFPVDKVEQNKIGHFTQMAWAKTTKVGCGINLQKTEGKTALITVCRYFPRGNAVNQPTIEFY